MFITQENKFGKLRIKVSQEVYSGSAKKTEWMCDCGKEKTARINSVISSHTKSCGKCNLITAEEISKRKFGKLRIKVPQDIKPGSAKKTEWVCDCGKEITTRIDSVLSGVAKSCGKCNLISAVEIAKQKFGKLRIKIPQDITPWSSNKIEWICDCGRETSVKIKYVISGISSSCGRCSTILADEIANKKFGKLRIKIPQDIQPKSEKEIDWICDCGKETHTRIHYVLDGDKTTCGKCNLILAADIAQKKFGKLRIKTPQDVLPKTHKKIEWICDCGRETTKRIYSVLSGNTKSCCKCQESVQNWYLNKRNDIQLLRCPINPTDFIPGGIQPLETIRNTSDPFKAECSACGSTYHPRLSDVKLGKSLTCGCSTNRVSLAQRQIKEFIESLGIESELEYKVGILKYDIFIPKSNLLIEYNGLKWHSYSKAKAQDIQKYQNAISSGFSYLMIFEDEWLFNRSKVETLLKNKLGIIRSISIRPSECEIKSIKFNEADSFYDKFHYIGPVKARVNYGVYFAENLITCISFKRPTRQSSHDWELVRMASDPEFRVHGIWSKLLRQFVTKYSPKSIVSFSDNRLFDGRVYEKIGFQFDEEIRPDYYWTIKNKRFHKSALRKTNAEKLTGQTEYQLREAQGYKRIWDLGKKRWIFLVE